MLKLLKTTALATTLAVTAGVAHATDIDATSVPGNDDKAGAVQMATTANENEISFDEQKKAVEETFESWVDQIAEHAEQADDNAEEVAEDAGEALDEAWAEVRASWEEVKDASEENWEVAKDKFDVAVERLEAAWNELKGNDLQDG
ncbi:hypothetical protein [Hwanghaeella sp.]|uniref:hypothetical protein n=1 Tax=Hwanghaeella sp. TaxID=2605943 RepID=UPI003CCB86C0